MALNKLKYNSLNVTPVANKAISFDSDPDALEATLSGGAMTFISKSTASSSSNISFTSGIDSTYKEYVFIFNNLHPSATQQFQFNLSVDGGSNYNVTKTTTFFRTYGGEDADDGADLLYQTEFDLAQGTGNANLYYYGGTNNDDCWGGYLHLFNPSSTTFVKHFISNISGTNGVYEHHHLVAGYGNTTSAVNAIKFEMSSGNIDSGTITLYGIN